VSDPVPIDVAGEVGADPEPVMEGADSGTGTLTRAEIIDGIRLGLEAEGIPPFTAQVPAEMYATSWELSQMLAALDQAGGLGGIGGLLGGFLGRRRAKNVDGGSDG